MNTKEFPQDDLMAVQLQLEEAMTSRGAERFVRMANNAREHEREDSAHYGKTLMLHRISTFSEAIRVWMDEACAGRAGNRVLAFQRVKGMKTDTLAYLALKHIIAGLTTVRTLQKVAVAIGTAIEDEMRLSSIRAAERKKYNSIVEGAKKRTSAHYKHVYAVRRADLLEDGWNLWSRIDRLHVGCKLIDLCVESIGLVDVITQSEGKNNLLKTIKVREDVLEWLTARTEAMSVMRPVYEPMVVRPRDWTTPHDGGYISTAIKPLHLVKSSNRAYQSELADTDMPVVYAAVNALQQTAWQINTPILDVMKSLWNSGSVIAGLPPKDGIELPVPPADVATNELARRVHRVEAAKVHRENLTIRSKRVHFATTLDVATRYSPFKAIFMPYQLDFRGRIYAVPSLNCQGNDTTKALLRFSKGKRLGAEGWKWLAVHGANLAGVDKVSFEDRVNWVMDNEEEILAIAENPYDHRGWCGTVGEATIDKPWQFLAFCKEWAGYCEHGEDFVSKIPCAADGSCSGVQHFSGMLRDEVGGASVNLIPMDAPADVYRAVAERVLVQVHKDLVDGTEDEIRHLDPGQAHREDELVRSREGVAYVKEGTKTLAKQWLSFGVTRKVTKRSVMTLCYGSKQYGFKEQLLEDIISPAKRAATNFPFTGDGYMAAGYMAKLIWDAVTLTLVKASEAMKWLQETAALAASDNLPLRWTTPVGFPVMQAYPATLHRRIETSISGSVIKLNMHTEKENDLDRRAQSQGVSPNFVHACDASHMMLTTVRAKQRGIDNFAMIHDSFGTLAADMQTMYEVVRESFVEMYETADVLGDFRDAIYGQLDDKLKKDVKPIPVRGTLDLSQVIESRYCFA